MTPQRVFGYDTLWVLDGSSIPAAGDLYAIYTDMSGTMSLLIKAGDAKRAMKTLERGWAEDMPFERWLNERIWLAESALEEED